jgi:hypothetical protein
LRAGPENNGKPRRFAFQEQASNPMAAARSPSANHTRSHAKDEIWLAASHAAPAAVTPKSTCPHPETAVKAADRSMVSRMNRKSSMTSGAVRDDVGRTKLSL